MSDKIEVVNLEGDLQHNNINVELQVSKNGGDLEKIKKDSVITDEFSLDRFISQLLEEKYGSSIKVSRSIMVTNIQIQFDSAIKERQMLEGKSVEDIQEEITDLKGIVQENNETILELANEAGVDVDVDPFLDEPLDLDLEDIEDDEIANKIAELIDDNETLDDEINELCADQKKIETFEKKITFGRKCPENFTLECSQILDNIWKNVPVGAFITYLTTYQKTTNFLQYDHLFKTYMIPLDMEFGGFDGSEFHIERTEGCYQALKDIMYQLYEAIPGKSFKEERL